MQAPNAVSAINSIALNIIAATLYAVTLWLGEFLYSRIAHRNPSYRRLRLLAVLLLCVGFNAASFVLTSSWWLVLLVTSIMLAAVIFRELNQFWKIGIVGADPEVRMGIGYRAALGMCRHSLDFLGIGAAKLTQDQQAFREAIDRCNRTSPVRLLLGRPDAKELQRFAQMAGKDKESYQYAVKESLRFIASLRDREQKNITVRFYQQFPAFRLMFIDDAICLMSYYIMGKGDGSKLPQLHIIKTAGSQDIDSLYFGFEEYFEKMWNDSTEWDFSEFL